MIRKWKNCIIFLAISTSILAKGTLVADSVFSDTLNREIKYQVYLPEGYSSEQSYPALFLLHGLTDNETTWTHPQKGNVLGTFDDLIEDGEIEPMVVVMPDGGNSWYLDGNEKIQTAFEKDLFPQMDKKYNLTNDRKKRAIAGNSMGGKGSLNFYLRNPQNFGNVILLSPAMYEELTPDFAEISPISQEDMKKGFYKNNMAQYKGTEEETNIFILVGDKDQLEDIHGEKFFPRVSFEIFEELREKGHNPDLRIVDGIHGWKIWKTGIVEALKKTIAKNK